jgi:flagellar biosynthesis protein FlhF
MNVKKFVAATSREAYRLVREALGADAVILSNRSVGESIEILALAGEEMSSIAEPAVESRPQRPARSDNMRDAQPEPWTWPQSQSQRKGQGVAEPLPKLSQSSSFIGHRPGDNDQAGGLADALAMARSDKPVPATDGSEMAHMMKEIRSMREMLESQLTELTWNGQQQRDPARKEVLRLLLAAGFSASLSRYLVEKMPARMPRDKAMAWVKSILVRNLATLGNENEILEQGGVFALVGPTGVGKTTTTAKLAARCVMRHGPGKLALITSDGYRIGGYEQLRIYGKILGVMVHSVKDEADLRIALDELKHKHTVLIDTVGVSQRDNMVAEQVAMLAGTGTPVKRLLCLSATSNGETLNEVVRAYQGSGLAGCILTKLDEAATLGSALDVVIRHKLKMYYFANGQRVPEDLHVAKSESLIDHVLRTRREHPAFSLRDDELPLVMANASQAMRDRTLQEVSFG